MLRYMCKYDVNFFLVIGDKLHMYLADAIRKANIRHGS